MDRLNTLGQGEAGQAGQVGGRGARETKLRDLDISVIRVCVTRQMTTGTIYLVLKIWMINAVNTYIVHKVNIDIILFNVFF